MTRNEFWIWFADHAAELRPKRIDADMVSALQGFLDELVGYVDWEIGPVGDGSRAFFALSPTSSDEEVNDNARQLIACAPVIDGWDLQLFKPRRAWEISFTIEAGRRQVTIEGASWSVVLGRGDDDLWDVTFVCDDSASVLPDEALERAAWTILDGELGTEKSRTLVGGVTVTRHAVDGMVPLTVGLLDRSIV